MLRSEPGRLTTCMTDCTIQGTLPSTPTESKAMAVVVRVDERLNLLATIMPMPQPSAARVTAIKPSAE